MPHMSDTHSWEIQIEGISDICQWIADKGGPNGLTTTNVFEAINSRLFNTPLFDEYIPTTTEVLGIINYRLGFILQGNNLTGCDFS